MAKAERPTFSSIIKNRGFRYLWANQILVQLAYNTINFALIIWVFKLTNSSLAVSTLVLSMYLPALFFGMFAGVFVDIADRRKIIILIDGLLAIAFASFILIKGSYPLILLDTFFINSLAQFFVPAEGSSIPMLVNRKQLLLANSLFSLTLYGSFMLGFSLAGPILSFFGINSAFLIGVAALSIAFLVAQYLPVIKVNKVHKKYDNFISIHNISNIFKITYDEMRETLGFIRSKWAILMAISLLACSQGVIGVLAVLMSSYMETVLHIKATDASYFLMIPLGLGMISGAYLIGRYAHNKPRRSIVVPALSAAGLIFILAGFTPDIAHFFQARELPQYLHPRPRFFLRAPSLSAMFALGAYILGLCAVGIIIPSQTVLQENTTEKMRGKIFAVLAVLMNVLSIIPVIVAGAISDVFGPTPIFVLMGAIIFIAGILASYPHRFFPERHLPHSFREFLGLGHWEN